MGLEWLAIAGAATRVPVARPGAARWRHHGDRVAVVPLALMSVGTSKLHHYAYPFLPPFALLVGLGPAWLRSVGSRLDGDDAGGIPGRGPSRRRAAGARRRLPSPRRRRGGHGGLDVRRRRRCLARRWRDALPELRVIRPLLLALCWRRWQGAEWRRRGSSFPRSCWRSRFPSTRTRPRCGEPSSKRIPCARRASACRRCVQASCPRGARRRAIYAIGERRWFLHSYFYYLQPRRRLGPRRAYSIRRP